MDETFPIQSEIPTQEPIDIGAEATMPVLSPAIASVRARKAHYGMSGVVDKSYDEIYNNIAGGKEDELRDEVSTHLDAQKATDAQDQIMKVVKDPTLTDQERMQNIARLAKQRPTDPTSVLEDLMSIKYVNGIYTLNNTDSVAPKFSWLHDLQTSFGLGSALQDDTDLATTAVSKYNYWKKIEDDLASEIKNQGYFGWSLDKIKEFSMVYNSLMLRENVQGTGFFDGGLLGENLASQRDALYNMPYPQMKEEGARIIEQLKKGTFAANPSIAWEFAHAMVGHTLDEKTLASVFELTAPLELQAVGQIGVDAVRAMNASRTAAKSMVRAAPLFEEAPPAVAAATALGDLSEAAIQRSTVNVLAELRGAPQESQRAVEALTSNFKQDKLDYRANPGRFGQEIVNRLDAMTNASESNFFKAITNMQRINRTPVAVTSEDVMRMLTEEMKGKAKGADNQVIDIHGPTHEPISNTYLYEIKLGTADGEFFKDARTAAANAQANGLVLRPTTYSALNSINQEIGRLNAVRTPADPEKHAQTLADLRQQRQDFINQNREALSVKGSYLPGSVGAQIVQDGAGAGWYINVSKYLKETDHVVRDNLITTQYNKDGSIFGNAKKYKEATRSGQVVTSMPPSWAGGYLNATVGWIRTPKEVLSATENAMRDIATHGPSILIKHFEKLGEEGIKPIPRKDWQDFERLITAGQKKIDTTTGEPGYWFKSPGEIEHWYQTNVGRAPEKSEIVAYFSYKNMNEQDRALREMLLHRNRAINGVEQHQISVPDGSGKGKTRSGYFDAIRQPNMPGGDDTIAVIGKDINDVQTYAANAVPPTIGKDLNLAVKEGRKIVLRIWDPEQFPLRDFSPILQNARPRYVIVDGSESKPIDWKSIPRRGGGHHMYEADFAVKQAIIHREVQTVSGSPKIHDWYHGDRTAYLVANRAMGEEYAAHMEEVRRLIQRGEEDGARNYHLSNKMPEDWDTFRSAFEPKGRVPARFSVDQPFRVVPRGKAIGDLDKQLEDQFKYVDPQTGRPGNSFKDGTRSGSDARMMSVEFTQKRDAYDLFQIDKKGPQFSLVPAPLIDPITAMDRGLARITNSTFMEDYKMYAAEHWLQQAKNHITASDSEIASAPFYHFSKPIYKNPASPEALALMSNLKKAKDFIGRPSVIDTVVHGAAQSLADSIYKATGKPGIALTPVHLLPYVSDPINFIRSVTYRAYMGMFNLASFFTQLNTHVNIYAVAPRHASSGTLGTLLYTYSRYNQSPEIMNFLDKMATDFNLTRGHMPEWLKVQWKPGWWKEATEMLNRSGFPTVGHEHAFLDTPISVDLLKNNWKKFLDAGNKPFELGAASTRVAGYYTAYLEWRAANPTAQVTRKVESDILARGVLMDNNMNRASNSVLHTGGMSVPFQFAAYQMRVAEMMTGKQLTPGEKFRLFAVNSVLWGLPMGTVGMLGLPLVDYVRKNMLDKGVPVGGGLGDKLQAATGSKPYVPGSGLGSTLAMEGGVAALSAFISGSGDMKKGNWWDFSKFGNKGLSPLQTAFQGDKTYMDVLGGASWNFMKHLVGQSSGFNMATMAMLSAGDDPNHPKIFPYKLDDVVDLAREVSSVNHSLQLYTALRTGEWRAKNGTVLDKNVSAPSAAFMATLGINPLKATDAYLKINFLKDQAEAEKEYQKIFIREYRRGMEQNDQGDKEGARQYFQRAQAALDEISPQNKTKAFSSAIEGKYKTISQKVDWDFYTIKAKPKNIEDKQNALQRSLQLGQ